MAANTEVKEASKADKLKEEIHALVKRYYQETSKRDFIPGLTGIPCSQKVFDDRELNGIVDAALDCWWTEGRITEEFKKRFSEYLGVKHAIVVNSGSSANLLALKTLCSMELGDRRLMPGDEVITVAASFPTTVNPIIECGCVPVFCDIQLPTYNIKIDDLKKAFSSKTKAVFIAHTLGNPFNVSKVKEFCSAHGLWLIEDNCDALGSAAEGRRTGGFGDISTHSFYPAHHITMGEGGCVCTSDDNLAKIAYSIRDWGRHCWCRTGQDNTCKHRFSWKLGELPEGYDHKYIYSEIGYNLKSTDLNVAIALAQLDKLEGFVQKRKENFSLLKEAFSRYNPYFILPEATENTDPSWFGFLLTLKEGCGFSRRELLEYLDKNKIGTRLLFGGNLLKQPYFVSNKPKHRMIGDLAGTDKVMNDTFWIGLHPGISKEMIDYIARKIGEFIESRPAARPASKVL